LPALSKVEVELGRSTLHEFIAHRWMNCWRRFDARLQFGLPEHDMEMDGIVVGGCLGLCAVAIGVCVSSFSRTRPSGGSQFARWLKSASIVALLMAGIGLSINALLLIHHSSFCDPHDPWANMVVRWLLSEIFIAFIFFCLIAAISPLIPQDKAASLLQHRSRRVVIVMVVCAVCCGAIVAMF
jgi:hypothetical protein